MKRGLVRDQPSTVGHHAKLTKIGNSARREFCISDNSSSLCNKMLPITVFAMPKVEHPRILVPMFQPAERVILFEDKIIFTGFSGCQNLQAKGFRPAVQTNQKAWLITFNLRIDNVFLFCHLVQDRAHNDSCFLGSHDNVAPFANGPFGNAGSGLRLARGFHQNVKVR